MSGMHADHGHRVTGVDHLRKNDQLGASLFCPTRKIANLQKIYLGIAERTRDLGNCNLHFIVILIPQWREKNLSSNLNGLLSSARQRCFASLNMTVLIMGCATLRSISGSRKIPAF